MAWDRYAYALNNPLRYTDPSGNWTADELEEAFGEDWQKRLFGSGGIFYNRKNLLRFLTSEKTTDRLTLFLISEMVNNLEELSSNVGININQFDAVGFRLSFSVGVGVFAGGNVDAILNINSGEFGYFFLPESGVIFGGSANGSLGLLLIYNLPSNRAYHGLADTYGITVGDFTSGIYEKSVGRLGIRNKLSDVYQSDMFGIGFGASAGVYLTESFAIEVLRVDESGYQFTPDIWKDLYYLNQSWCNPINDFIYPSRNRMLGCP